MNSFGSESVFPDSTFSGLKLQRAEVDLSSNRSVLKTLGGSFLGADQIHSLTGGLGLLSPASAQCVGSCEVEAEDEGQPGTGRGRGRRRGVLVELLLLVVLLLRPELVVPPGPLGLLNLSSLGVPSIHPSPSLHGKVSPASPRKPRQPLYTTQVTAPR